jgi:hypothetical protein
MTPPIQQPSTTVPNEKGSSARSSANGLRENQRIAEMLERVAELLEAQDASPFRAAAYRRAAIELRLRREGLRQLFDARGHRGLVEQPRIGPSIAAAIAEYLESGQMALLRGLEGHAAPEDCSPRCRESVRSSPAGCTPSSASRPSKTSRRPLTTAASSTSPASARGGCTR